MISRCIQDVPKMMQYGNIPHRKEGRAEPVIHMSYQVLNSFILESSIVAENNYKCSNLSMLRVLAKSFSDVYSRNG